MLPIGDRTARTTRTPSRQRKSGFSTFPTQVRISPGRREKNSTAAKNTAENTASAAVCISAGRILSTPTVNETVAQRGIARNGPIAR